MVTICAKDQRINVQKFSPRSIGERGQLISWEQTQRRGRRFSQSLICTVQLAKTTVSMFRLRLCLKEMWGMRWWAQTAKP